MAYGEQVHLKVFTATQHKDREGLGERISKWLDNNGCVKIVGDPIVRQSSDNRYHCLSIIVRYQIADGFSLEDLLDG